MILILFGFGLFYNFVIAEDDVVSEQEQQEEQQRNAVLDTVDVVGDYLWPNRKSRKRDLTTNEENVKSNSETKKNNEETIINTQRKAEKENQENNNKYNKTDNHVEIEKIKPITNNEEGS